MKSMATFGISIMNLMNAMCFKSGNVPQVCIISIMNLRKCTSGLYHLHHEPHEPYVLQVWERASGLYPLHLEPHEGYVLQVWEHASGFILSIMNS